MSLSHASGLDVTVVPCRHSVTDAAGKGRPLLYRQRVDAHVIHTQGGHSLKRAQPALPRLQRNGAHEVTGNVEPACHGSPEARERNVRRVGTAQRRQLGVVQALNSHRDTGRTGLDKSTEQLVAERLWVGLTAQLYELRAELPDA